MTITQARGSPGQAVVELALVLPIFVGLLLAVIGVGSFYGQRQTLIAATAAAARFESVCNAATTGDATTIGQSAMPNITPAPTFTYVLQGTSTAQPHAAGCAIASGTAITVTALAPNVTVKLYAFSISLPLTSSLTVVEQ